MSQQQWFFVIARNSSFTYKGEAVDVRQVASQLGVRYILEGSVRKSASRVRVTGQLIDAMHGNHLWADRYDRELADIFELQDEITTRVIGSVSPQILLAEAARVRRKPPQSIDAWDLVMQAMPHMWRMTTEDHRRAQDLLLEALSLDPEYAHAYALLGWIYVSMFNLDTGKPIHEFTERALDAGTRAVELDDQDPWGHLVLGLGFARRRQPDLALMHLTKAIELNPSFALGHAGLGYGLAVGGQPERGLEALEQAHRLSPRDPFLAIYAPTVRYMALFALGRYEETIAVCRETASLHPNHAGAWRLMTVSLALLGREDEARAALARTLDAAAGSLDRSRRDQHGVCERRRPRALPRRIAQGGAGELAAARSASPRPLAGEGKKERSMPLEGDQRAHRHVELAQLVGAAELRQVDDEAGGEHLGADLAQQLHGALGGAAGRDQVVDQHHAVALAAPRRHASPSRRCRIRAA